MSDSASGDHSSSAVMAGSGSQSVVGSGIPAVDMANGWLGSGSGVTLKQRPLYIFNKAPSRSLYGQECLRLLVEAGVVENT